MNFENLEIDDVINLCIRDFLFCENKEEYIRYVMECGCYSHDFKIKVISCCISVMWDTQFDNCSLDEWERILIEEQKGLGRIFEENGGNGWYEYYDVFILNMMRLAVIFAFTGNKARFDSLIKILLIAINRDLVIQLEEGGELSEFELLCSSYSRVIDQVVDALKNIGKVYWVVSHLVESADRWEEYVLKEELSQQEAFAIYRFLVQITEKVIQVENIEVQDGGDIYNLYNRYKEKVRDLAGASKSELIKNI